jgi:small GTP-binding protein
MFTSKIKIVLLGDFSTGKTSIIERYLHDSYRDAYHSTIGVHVSKKYIDDQTVILLWDIEGRTDIRQVDSSYLEGTGGAVIVSDVTQHDSIDHIQYHLDNCYNTVPDIPIALAFNKQDLDPHFHPSLQDVGSIDLKHYNIISLKLTSAKTGHNINKLFTPLIDTILAQSLPIE